MRTLKKFFEKWLGLVISLWYSLDWSTHSCRGINKIVNGQMVRLNIQLRYLIRQITNIGGAGIEINSWMWGPGW